MVRHAKRVAVFKKPPNPPRSTKKNRTKKSTPSKRYSEIVALCFIRACFESEYRLRGSTTKIQLNGKGFSKKEKPCKIARIFVGFDTQSVWLFENSLIHPAPQRKTALISADFHGGEGGDSFNSAGLHLCKLPKRQHRKVVRCAQRTAV